MTKKLFGVYNTPNSFLYLGGVSMERLKNWLIVHCAENFKITTSIMMLGTALSMLMDKLQGSDILPDYFQFTNTSWWVWAIILTIVGTSNLIMLLFVNCCKCRVFSDVLLQISGILLLIIGWVFIAHYPPLNALMVIYPIWGIGMVVAGRHMGKRTREEIKGNK